MHYNEGNLTTSLRALYRIFFQKTHVNHPPGPPFFATVKNATFSCQEVMTFLFSSYTCCGTSKAQDYVYVVNTGRADSVTIQTKNQPFLKI